MRFLTNLFTLFTGLDGAYESFHDNGQLLRRENFVDNEQDGLWERFYENGQLSSRTNYIDGLQDGLREEFSVNGNLKRSMTFRNGVQVKNRYSKPETQNQ